MTAVAKSGRGRMIGYRTMPDVARYGRRTAGVSESRPTFGAMHQREQHANGQQQNQRQPA
ncbi:MAG: hypothetical protein J0H71_07595 [Rhizobiales bacterium]|nr:hypothetical protein [Hyphomicrobiales bacterium]